MIVLEYPDVFVTVVSTVVILDSFLSDVIVSAVSVTTTSGGGFAIGVDATRLVEDCILQKKTIYLLHCFTLAYFNIHLNRLKILRTQ